MLTTQSIGILLSEVGKKPYRYEYKSVISTTWGGKSTSAGDENLKHFWSDYANYHWIKRMLNLAKMLKKPYHLIKSKKMCPMKTRLLTNFLLFWWFFSHHHPYTFRDLAQSGESSYRRSSRICMSEVERVFLCYSRHFSLSNTWHITLFSYIGKIFNDSKKNSTISWNFFAPVVHRSTPSGSKARKASRKWEKINFHIFHPEDFGDVPRQPPFYLSGHVLSNAMMEKCIFHRKYAIGVGNWRELTSPAAKCTRFS